MTSNKLFLTSYLLLSLFVIANCSTSEEKCKEYKELFKNFEDPTFSIDVRSKPKLTTVGKQQVEYGEFPHMVALLYNVSGTLKALCGGVLINERYVLTTAVCKVYAWSKSLVSHVRLGEHNIHSDSDDKNVQEIKVKKTILHPDWKIPSLYNDIMLIELSEPVKFNKFVRPACLYTKSELPSNTKISATGWGVFDWTGTPADILHKVYLDIFSHEECNKKYLPSRRRLPNGIDDKTMICAGGKTTPKDTCQGDAGGPLQFYNENMNNYEIVGLTSYGKSTCGVQGAPSVYTRVSAYVPWIESIIWKD